MKHIVCFSFVIVFAANTFAAGFTRTAQGIKTSVASANDMNVEVQFITPDIVRIYKTPQNSSFKKTSYSVIKTPENVKFTVANTAPDNNNIELKSVSLQVLVNTETGRISFHTADGKNLFTEKDFGAAFTPFNDAGNATYTVSQQFTFEKNEAVYGLGQQQTDRLNQRNSTILLKQRYLHACIPVFHSIKGYGVFWDNYSTTTFADSEQGLSLTSEVGECIDYYFMYGKNGDGTIAQIRELTGQAQMFPLWTYGFWQSRERYRSQYELTETVEKYRSLGIPLDGIIQDWQYWGGNTNWNSMNFDNPEFPDPQAMVDYVHSQNAHIMISVWASFGPDTKPYADLNKTGALMDFTTWPPSAKTAYPPDMNYPSGVRVYDAYNRQAREIYWQHLKRGLYNKGIDAWWLDSTEPDHHFEKESDFDQQTAMGTYRSVINLFPLMTNMGMYEHLRAENPDRRVFMLTRCAFAGQQRYAAQTWSGDVQSTWDALRRQIPTGLNFSMSGIPYWNSDIGGFFLNDYDGKTANKAYLELYTRWFQYATFTPMQRSHGSDVKKEIYNLGKRGDWVFDSEELYINLRYRLLPYIYSTAWNVTAGSGSFLRPLFMDFAADTATHNAGSEYMFGSAFLVAPVTEPFYVTSSERKWRNPKEDFSHTQMRRVYLPKGTGWFDFWTGEQLAGGQTVNRPAPINIIPLYVRAGSILPIAPKVQYAAEKRWDDLEIRIYAGADGSFTLYEDENDGYNYEKGLYATIDFIWNDRDKTLTIGKTKGNFVGMLKTRKFRIVLADKTKGFGADNSTQTDKTVIYSGKQIKLKM